ncbi:Retrovirus-related Pol polyprotein from transposon 17.6 [Abeliophyllum distichum]|uniref:Retrovirus-related Pol polyprotein from transposon 17.6 n=1 Tax=Abeliophyllum distichum TaxID=126358 RepID=A0ABD1UNY7_9LAMI
MEVYIDDMLVKSVNTEDHIGHLREMFEILHKYRIKLNPLKFSFGVTSGKFLGYMVNKRGIEVNPKKIKALVDMRSPSFPKEIPKIENGYADALSKLASSKNFSLMRAIPVEKLSNPSIDEAASLNVMVINEFSKWVKEIVEYLTDQVSPEDKKKPENSTEGL